MKTVNKIVMAIAGMFLIVAAALKSHQILTEPVISKGFWESWAFFVIQIPLEFGLGIWLVCGLFRKVAWLLGTIAFGGFIIVTSHLALTGASSCGCFGTVHVNPWITLCTIDIPLFIMMLIFRPKDEKFLPPPWPSAKHFFGVAIPTFIFLGILVPVLIFNKPPEQTEKYVVVHPEQWSTAKPVTPAAAEANESDKAPAAQEWPLLKSIDIANSLRQGIVVALLYHHDCPDCAEAIPQYDKISREMGSEGVIRFVFIAVPPYGTPEQDPVPADSKCLRGKLDASKKWYFQTPLVVLLQDGAVVKSWEGKAPSLDDILNALGGS
jgi:thiol-disulfide isomerase/thioredoxin